MSIKRALNFITNIVIPAKAGISWRQLDSDRFHVNLLLLFLLFFLATAISCASTWQGKKYEGGKAPAGKAPGTITREAPVEKDIIKPGKEQEQFAMIGSPQRKASMDMVVKGKAQLDAGEFDKALGNFQEAVIIDSRNGIAYYYLAKARFLLGQNDEALGILDKAESLLNNSEEWTETIDTLKEQIIETKRENEAIQNLQ